MSNFDKQNKDRREPAPGSDDSVQRLMKLAGPRETVPADIERRVHERVRQEWQRSVVRRRALRWSVPLAFAASAVLAIVVIGRSSDKTADVALTPVAEVARINGDVTAAANRLSVGDPIFSGDTITTAVGQGLSLAMNRNLSLRIAADTTVKIVSADEVTLVSGRVYADSGRALYPDRHMTIVTAAGSATDIGTQFAVSYLQNEMSVAVREGAVDVTHQSNTYTAGPGDKLVLPPDSDTVFKRISKYDESWNWAIALAPAFDIDNRSLLDFLEWASRETGKDLKFENHDIRAAAGRTILRGSVSHFTPSEALHSVLATTRFDYSIDRRQIAIAE